MLNMMVEWWYTMVHMLSWHSGVMNCSTVGDVYVHRCVWQNNILHTKVGFSQTYFKQPPYSDYKIRQCIWINENLLSRLYPTKSLAEMNPAMVCPEKQHLGGALRRRASCCSFCEKIFKAHFSWYPCNFCLVTKGFTKALHFHFEIKYLNTSSSCAYLVKSELLQTQGRTPGQWSISS